MECRKYGRSPSDYHFVPNEGDLKLVTEIIAVLPHDQCSSEKLHVGTCKSIHPRVSHIADTTEQVRAVEQVVLNLVLQIRRNTWAVFPL